jgi:uncharacterized protein YdiU (UPF0061 family)
VSADPGWRLDHTYSGLPAEFWAAARPAPFRGPKLVAFNRRLAADLGLDPDRLADPAVFTGQTPPAGANPIAQAYAGHQYGHQTMLGDGRAILLGEHLTPAGRRVDIQLKGAGPTRFSRGGDGRAALGPMLREYLVSEAMHALGVPTTRSLAVAVTGEPVFRESPRRGAVLTRVAASHLRVGTFEYAAALEDVNLLRTLADYAIARHDPELVGLPDRHLRFFRAVRDRQAALVARWQGIGFVHGVLNTDNVAVSGETIDYGPCAFLNGYDPSRTFSSIDRGGRYAFGRQPAITHWNLARFAESLLPLFDPSPERAVELGGESLAEFPGRFDAYWLAEVRRKLGLLSAEAEDLTLANDLLAWMATVRADWTNTFADLSPDAEPCDPGFRDWHRRWVERLARQGRPAEAAALMWSANPQVVPRNHRVEEALMAAEERDDFGPFEALLGVVTKPFEPPARPEFRDPPADDAGYRTFCGT